MGVKPASASQCVPRSSTGTEDDDARQRGTTFHDLFAQCLLADNPEEAFESAVLQVPTSEVQHYRRLWDQHQALEASQAHRIEYRVTEYQVGVTVEVEGVDVDSQTGTTVDGRRVAVVFMGRADATG